MSSSYYEQNQEPVQMNVVTLDLKYITALVIFPKRTNTELVIVVLWQKLSLFSFQQLAHIQSMVHVMCQLSLPLVRCDVNWCDHSNEYLYHQNINFIPGLS